MKILASGDWQLGLGGPDRFADQEAAAEKIVDLAIERDVDLFLHGGDVLEGPASAIMPEHLRVFRQSVERLHAAGIPTMATSGNSRHDAAMRDANGLDIFNAVPGCTVASRADVYRFDGCTVGALPWVHVGRMVAAAGGGDRDNINEEASALLLRVATGLLEDCRRVAPDLPAVLLAHWSLTGATTSTGLPTDMIHEPVIDTDALCDLGFDAIVASHIHRPQYVTVDEFGLLAWVMPLAGGQVIEADAVALYTGSPLILDFGEAGHPHGAWILDLAHGPQHPQAVNGGGEAASSSRYEFVPIEGRPWITLDVAADDLVDPDAAWCPSLDEGAIVRLRYTATSEQQRRIDVAAIRAQLNASGASSVKIEPEIVREHRARVDGVDEDLAPLEAFDLWATANELDPTLAARARERMSVLLEQVV